MPHILLVDGIEGSLFEGEGDFDEAFISQCNTPKQSIH